jgi:hypothetical protein
MHQKCAFSSKVNWDVITLICVLSCLFHFSHMQNITKIGFNVKEKNMLVTKNEWSKKIIPSRIPQKLLSLNYRHVLTETCYSYGCILLRVSFGETIHYIRIARNEEYFERFITTLILKENTQAVFDTYH